MDINPVQCTVACAVRFVPERRLPFQARPRYFSFLPVYSLIRKST